MTPEELNGFTVFPVRDKQPLVQWTTAEFDPTWELKFPDADWAIDCGRSGLVVIDLDVTNGKNGPEAWDELAAGRTPLTRSAITPSGGEHLYFQCPDPYVYANSSSALAHGIDVRAGGGYVVAYPHNDTPPAPLPNWLAEKLQKRAERKTAPAPTESPESAIDRATSYLKTADPAIEGQGGNARTFQVLARLRDLGLSEDDALSLTSIHFNPRCAPPWDATELERLVRNAYTYAKNDPAAASPEAAFAEYLVEAQPLEPVASLPTRIAATIDVRQIPPRDWLLPNVSLTRYVRILVAPGGVGKSTLATLEAVSLATGQKLTHSAPTRPTNTLVYNAEDPLDEIEMRVAAVASHANIPIDQLTRLHLLSGRDVKFRLLKTDNRGNHRINTQAIQTIKDYITTHRIEALYLDPFVRTHDAPENDNMAIDKVAEILTDLAHEQMVAISVVHHSRKLNATTGQGDQDTARGASSLMSAARIAHTLSVMDEKDAKRFGIPDDRRKWYVRFDDAKLNLAPPAESAIWYERHSVKLPNGESIGVLEHVDLARVTDGDEDVPSKLLQYLVEYVREHEGIVPLATAVSDLAATPFFLGRSERTIRRVIRETVEDDKCVAIRVFEGKIPGFEGGNCKQWILAPDTVKFEVK